MLLSNSPYHIANTFPPSAVEISIFWLFSLKSTKTEILIDTSFGVYIEKSCCKNKIPCSCWKRPNPSSLFQIWIIFLILNISVIIGIIKWVYFKMKIFKFSLDHSFYSCSHNSYPWAISNKTYGVKSIIDGNIMHSNIYLIRKIIKEDFMRRGYFYHINWGIWESTETKVL